MTTMTSNPYGLPSHVIGKAMVAVKAQFGGRLPTREELAALDRLRHVQCPSCQDTGMLKIYTSTGKYGWDTHRWDLQPCSCQAEIIRDRRATQYMAASNLTPEMVEMTFATFTPSRDAVAYTSASDFAANPDGWIIFMGDTGTGKTHLLAAISHALLAQGRRPLFVVAPDFLDYLKAGFDKGDAQKRFDQVRDADVLLIDDLGAENDSGWAEERFYSLFNHRYARRLPTVIATNVPLQAMEMRIRSRLKDRALCQQVIMTAKDYRSSAERAKERKEKGAL